MVLLRPHLFGSAFDVGDMVMSESSEALAKTTEETESAAFASSESDHRRIACWGDSLTAGVGASPAFIEGDGGFIDASFLSYPEILEKLTGIKTLNYGVSGATSEQIVFLQKVIYMFLGLGWFDNAKTTQDGQYKEDVLVLEIGSNGGWKNDYDTLIEQYWEMINRSGCADYIVVGDTDDPGTSIADEKQTPLLAGQGLEETEWEAALRAAFGDHFINMRTFLVERGLEIAGLEATEEDDEAASRGCVSDQLRSDWTHLNSYGYFAQATAVFEKGRELGYW